MHGARVENESRRRELLSGASLVATTTTTPNNPKTPKVTPCHETEGPWDPVKVSLI